MSDAPTLPSGIVTFLFTDLEDSTRLWERHGVAMRDALARHDAIMQSAIDDHGGVLIKHTGDGVHAVFAHAEDAAAACIASQIALQRARFGPIELWSRMAIYTGTAEQEGHDYRGPVLNRAARLMAAGHGGQVLVSQSTCAKLHERLPPHVQLRDMGMRRLRDVPEPERVFQLVADGLVSTFPPLRTIDVRPANLPAATNSFLGRERELLELTHVLREGETRLLTLSGPGGTGKTRLAVEVARQVVDAYADGVVFVPLAAVVEPEMVLTAIAQAFDLRESFAEGVEREIGALLRDKELLLVLDNFEQVVDAAPVVSRLLEASARLNVLITSRELLQVSGEYDYPVEPLAVPDLRRLPETDDLARVDSVALFLSRARAVNAELQLSRQNAATVAQVCCRLDGLPLAIELAAARARVVPLERMLREIENRLRFLVGGPRNEPERRRTLRATIDWSYDSLTADEQSLFRRLSVFVDGGALEAIDEVCGAGIDVLAVLESLIVKSLVRRSGTEESPRFSMLETIRDYARERLAGTPDANEAAASHTGYFTRLAEQSFAVMRGPQQGDSLQRLECDHENLRAALAREAATVGATSGLRLCAALRPFWSARGYLSEGRLWCERMLQASAGVRSDLRSKTTYALAMLAAEQGDLDFARPLLEAGVAEYRASGQLRRAERALHNLGALLAYAGELSAARRAFEESLAIKREIGEVSGIPSTLTNLAKVVFETGDLALARALLEEAVAGERELGTVEQLAFSLASLGTVACMARDLRVARRACEESIAILRRHEINHPLVNVLLTMGDIEAYDGSPVAASGAYAESLALAAQMGLPLAVAEGLEAFAKLAVAARQPLIAARNLGNAARIREEIKIPVARVFRADLDAAAAEARTLAGDAAFEEAFRTGRDTKLEAAVEYALRACDA